MFFCSFLVEKKIKNLELMFVFVYSSERAGLAASLHLTETQVNILLI